MSPWRLTLSVSIAMLAGATWTSVAHAQNESPDAMFERGRALRAQHRDADALAVFQQLFASSHQPRAQAQVGLAEGALGQWVAAEADLAAVLAGRRDAWVAQNRAMLENAIATVRTHVGDLDVQCSAPHCELWIANQRVATLPLEHPVRVPAGVVNFEARASGYLSEARAATVPAGGLARESVNLTAVQTEEATAPSPAPAQTPHPMPQLPPPPPSRTGPIAVMAVGAVALLAGAAMTVFANLDVASLNAGCTQDAMGTYYCDGSQQSRYGTDATLNWAGIGTLAGGAVILAAGAVWFVMRAPSDRVPMARRRMPHLGFIAAPGAFGVTLGGAL